MGDRGGTSPLILRGFTLVELLAVITIIGLLAGMLIPAIAGAVGRAKEAACQAELNLLATALTNFKAKYGEYPPSRILLCETGNYGQYMTSAMGSDYRFASPSANDVSTYQLAARSLMALRKFWPRMNLSAVTSSSYPDFNGNGKQDNPYVLEGDECLVWFLGGVPLRTSITNNVGNVTSWRWAMYGTGANPVNPFPSTGITTVNRTQPFYDFKSERLLDVDGDGIPCYADSYTQDHPIAYFASYGGVYDPNDVNYDKAPQGGKASPFLEEDGTGSVSPPMISFRVPFPTRGASTSGSFATSPPPNPYTTTLASATTVIYQNPSTFQLIAAGKDGLYGVGGAYRPDLNEPLTVEPGTSSNTSDAAIRQRENDNLANFHASRLN